MICDKQIIFLVILCNARSLSATNIVFGGDEFIINLIEKLHQTVKNITRKMLYGVQIDSQTIKNLNATEAYIGLEAINKMNAALQQQLEKTISSN